MICPVCGKDVRVVDNVNDDSDNKSYRKRRCLSCGADFYTVEQAIPVTDEFRDIWKKNKRQKIYGRKEKRND